MTDQEEIIEGRQTEERLRSIEETVRAALVETKQWRADVSDRLDKLEDQELGRFSEIRGEWEEWRAGHEKACQGLVEWLTEFTQDFTHSHPRNQGRTMRFLRRIWGADSLLPRTGDEPPTDP